MALRPSPRQKPGREHVELGHRPDQPVAAAKPGTRACRNGTGHRRASCRPSQSGAPSRTRRCGGCHQTVAAGRLFNRDERNARQDEGLRDPLADVAAQPQPPPLHQQRDSPGCDRRHRHPVGLNRLLDQAGRARAKSPIPFHGPDERVRVEHDQRGDPHSEGSAAGAKGSSYARTVPAIAPMIDADRACSGKGDASSRSRERCGVEWSRRREPRRSSEQGLRTAREVEEDQ